MDNMQLANLFVVKNFRYPRDVDPPAKVGWEFNRQKTIRNWQMLMAEYGQVKACRNLKGSFTGKEVDLLQTEVGRRLSNRWSIKIRITLLVSFRHTPGDRRLSLSFRRKPPVDQIVSRARFVHDQLLLIFNYLAELKNPISRNTESVMDIPQAFRRKH
jgi:hypothetical protein